MAKRPTLAQLQAQFRAGLPSDKEPNWIPNYMKQTPRAPRKIGVKNNQTEHEDQATCVTYLHKFCPNVIVSANLTGELYGLSRHVPEGVFYGFMNKLKMRGKLTGIPDLVLHWNPGKTCYVEMKTRTGKENEAQIAVRKKLQAMGFGVHICRGIDDLRKIIKEENIPCIDNLC